ncbi:hypothetical protein H6P81_008917 [Aristolochia fimbriata]|uniref:GrpE protein homolog n=1 Tax=Aristolochia fimbriata TaxID=158543 RepID=A0AAV7EML2_ARIFI|nr:hypothetical protein H6P81_008917 [Aristolochia fimbriata]
MAARVFSKLSRNGVGQFRLFGTTARLQLIPSLSNESKYSLQSSKISDKRAPLLVGRSHCSYVGRTIQGFRFSSSASPQTSDKEVHQSTEEQRTEKDEEELSVDDLVKLVTEKEELLKAKQKEVEVMKDKALRSYAEMENVIERTKRESENSKKFAIQSFAKSLLEVADNLGRASSTGWDSLAKVDQSSEPAEGARRLKELLEGVEMTEKQLKEVFKKFGLEKYDPLNEEFDPNRHHAVVQIPDPSKPPGTVAAVLKAGYTLHERIIRPAEVIVVSERNTDANDTEQSPAA